MTAVLVTAANRRAAWAVHVLTGTGVIVGMLGLHAVIGGHARAAILWLVAALVLDGIDGPLARKLDVRVRIPTIDGNALDLVIDYFTCTIVPVAFLDRFGVLPDDFVAPIGFTILLVSALWMARTDQETPDGWFRGFPAEWNVIVPTLFLVGANRWVNAAICVALCVLTLTRVQFPHPVSVTRRRPVTLTFFALWLGSMVWLAVAQRPILAAKVILITATMWTAWQVLERSAQRNGDEGPLPS